MLYILAVINSLLMVSGQVLWKLGVSTRKFHTIFDIIIGLLNPFVIAGLVIYGLATILWLFVLNRGAMTKVYPIQSLAFIFAMIAGSVIFKEKVNLINIMGAGLIVSGVILTTWK